MNALLVQIRVFFLPLLTAALLAFAGCGGKPSNRPPPKPGAHPTLPSNGETLEVHFLDVDNGDSVLIDLGETEILIDGGLPHSGVVQCLNPHVDGPLEVMVATHPHPDHIGGLMRVLQAFGVNEIWLNGDSCPPSVGFSGICEEFTRLVKEERALIRKARRGQIINMGPLSFLVLHPGKLLSYAHLQDRRRIFKTMNNNSLVLAMRYGEIRFLFAGDAHKEAEGDILRSGLDLRADILKLGHHGSIWSSSPQFLDTVRPRVAVYMAPRGTGGLGPKKPHPDTIAALKKAGVKVYGTNIHGTVIMSTDGRTYSVETKR